MLWIRCQKFKKVILQICQGRKLHWVITKLFLEKRHSGNVFKAKMPAKATRDSHYCAWLGHPGVNFTNILWAAFAPKSFCQKITNPNCKHIKGVQSTLIWLSISPIFYKQLFHTKVLCAPFMCLQFGFVIFWEKGFGAKAAHKMLVKLTPGRHDRDRIISIFLSWLPRWPRQVQSGFAGAGVIALTFANGNTP